MIISSLENDKIKNISKLQQKKYRDLTNTFVVEGEHLVEEGKKANAVLEIFTTDENRKDSLPTTIVTKEVMKKISSMDTPPNIIALCKKKDKNEIKGNRILLLDEIQDPGNLGTIIRSSLAFNVDTIILSEKCVDYYNPKVLRATQGIFFHCNVIEKEGKEAIKEIKKRNISVFGTSVENGEDIRSLSQEEKKTYCLIMGNEGNGISKDLLAECDRNLYIEMNPKVESLNVGVACSILLYEFNR